MEKEKEENIWRREIFFAEEKEKEKREGKVRKYLRRKIFICGGEEKTEKEIEENI